MGTYKARIENASGKGQRFRLLLYARLPDRIHGEVVTPVGSTRLILDGGDGRLAVTFVGERRAYVGTARPEILEHLLGVRIGLDELVKALLTDGPVADGLSLRRFPAGAGLPQRLELQTEANRLTLERKRLRALDVDPGTLGNAIPPDGNEVRPLERLPAEVEALGGLPGEGS